MRIDELNLRAGEHVYIGAPAQDAIGEEGRNAIARAAFAIEGVREAHLPQIYATSISDTPAQTLVLVLDAGNEASAVMSALGPCLSAIVPRGVHLDVWPMYEGNDSLPAIRGADCQLFARASASRPWWKLWG